MGLSAIGIELWQGAFYTEPLLTEQDADDVSLDVKDRKDIEASVIISSTT